MRGGRRRKDENNAAPLPATAAVRREFPEFVLWRELLLMLVMYFLVLLFFAPDLLKTAWSQSFRLMEPATPPPRRLVLSAAALADIEEYGVPLPSTSTDPRTQDYVAKFKSIVQEEGLGSRVARYLMSHYLVRMDRHHDLDDASGLRLRRACALCAELAAEKLESQMAGFVAYRVQQCEKALRGAEERRALWRRLPAMAAAPGSIDHRHELSLEEYRSKYDNEPVVITGRAVSGATGASMWSLAHVKAVCGEVRVRVMKPVPPQEAEFAGLKPLSDLWPLREFIDHVSTPGASPLYLFDWPLSQCPGLLKDYVVPKYVAGDLLQRIQGLALRDSWPSLLIGPQGSQSALHVDNYETHFYMILLAGRKKWRVFPRADRSALYRQEFPNLNPNPNPNRDPNSNLNPSSPGVS